MKDDLIWRRELLEHLHRKVRSGNDVNIDKEMLEFPAVDAVEVVRCKDCKHYKTQNKSARWNHETLYCMRSAAVKVKPDDFCSYGVRREDDA